MSTDARSALFSMKPKTEPVVIDGVGTFNVRGMLASEAIEMAAASAGSAQSDIPMLVHCVVDDDGKPLFTADDIPRLTALPMAALMPLLETAKRLTGLGEKEKKA